MYKIVQSCFCELYNKYHIEDDKNRHNNYSYYLNSVREDGTELFNVPLEYQTNDVIMTALETSQKPLHLTTREILENIIHLRRIKYAETDRRYHAPMSEEEHEYYLGNLDVIINFEYQNKFRRNQFFKEKKLYTFLDFFSEVCKYFSGLDTICYLYLYRGEPIPIRIKVNGEKSNYKLLYNTSTKILYLDEIPYVEYETLRSLLSCKLENYYGNNLWMDEYCWDEFPTKFSVFPILQDGEYYDSFRTIEEDGILYDYSHSYIFSVAKDIIEFKPREGIMSLPIGCCRGNKSLKKIILPSTLSYIPQAAFLDCEALEEVIINSDGLNNYDYNRIIIGSAAFCNCKSLKTIDMSKLELENGAELTFAYCRLIEDISDLDLGYFNNNKMNFFHCDHLKKLNSDPHTKYGDYDLAFCLNIREITIQSNVPTGLLLGCEGLASVKISESNRMRKVFGAYCFADCKSLLEIDTMKGGALIGEYSFAGCEKLSKFVICKDDEWYTEISITAFEGSPQVQLEWVNDSSLPFTETIEDYWTRKNEEVNATMQREKNNAIRAKKHLLSVFASLHSNKESICTLFQERGRYIGMDILNILKYDVCLWDEYLTIGKLFYKCIPYSNMDDEDDIRIALVSWAKSCSVQAYLKAPIHNKFDAIQLIFDILKVAHCSFENQEVANNEKSQLYSKRNVLNTDFDFHEYEEKLTEEQKSFISEYTSFYDIRMAYILQYYLLKHLNNYYIINKNDHWNYLSVNNDLNKIFEFANKFGNITPSFLMDFSRIAWSQFIKDDIERNYSEMGTITNEEYNEEDYLSFDYSTMMICREIEKIVESLEFGDNLFLSSGIEKRKSRYPYYDDEDYEFSIYRGSYAQDEMGYSDDDIDTIFDGDPSAYWNID